jgi:signal transduction histidine kinase
MNRIIRGVLDIERIRAESLSEEICCPDVIVADSVAELESFISEKDIALEVQIKEGLSGFVGDHEQFVRVLVNLIENAVKFTLGDGIVKVKVYEEGSELIFQVEDNGVGIPLVMQSRVFDRFFRGQQKSVEHVTGSGLGLNLAKTIVENHRGRIWLESEEGKGTTFFVAVPVANR